MTLKSPSLKELATNISTQASTIQDFLEKNGKQQPSFAVDGLRSWDFPEIGESRMALIEAATDILQLALGPNEYLKYQALTVKWDQCVLGALNSWNVFDNVPLDGSITYSELAKKCNVPESRLRRFIKHAMTNHIFWAPTPDTVSHTSTSAEVVRAELLYAWLGHNLEETVDGSTKLAEAVDRWGDINDPKLVAMLLAQNLDKDYESCFAWFEADGKGEPPAEILEGKRDKSDRTRGWRARRFGNAMKSMMSSGPHAATHVHGGFDWESLGKATVVDMGGSIGHVSVEIASKHPNLTIIDQDFAYLEPQFDMTVPEDMKARVTFQTHDFFTPQTVKADVYFLKHVLHDWSDFHCTKIIQNIISVMQKGNRIIVMDGVMPELGEAPNMVVRINTSLDLQMMAAINAKERTKQDWLNLFHTADKRLNVKAFNQPPGSAVTLIEVVFED